MIANYTKKSEYKNVKKAIEMRDIYPLFKNTGQNNVYNNKKKFNKNYPSAGISHQSLEILSHPTI